MLLSRGEIAFIGEPDAAIEKYRSEAYKTALSQESEKGS